MLDPIGDRFKLYENSSNPTLLRRVPLVVRLDGRSFTRVCRRLREPYEPLFLEAMVDAALGMVGEIDGAVYIYQQSDEISFILKNDQSLESQPWFANRIQKIASITASLATLYFYKAISKFNLDLVGDTCFDSRVFPLPNLAEAVNYLVWRQKDCQRNAVSKAAKFFLTQKYGKKSTLKLLHKKSMLERLILLEEECGIIFEEEFPLSYRNGVAIYKTPISMILDDGTSQIRKNWRINWELGDYTENRESTFNILLNGQDIIRAENIIAP